MAYKSARNIHMCMWVHRMHVCRHIHPYPYWHAGVCLCVCVYVCMCVRTICVCVWVCVFGCIRLYMCMHLHANARMGICQGMNGHVSIYVHIYI